MEYDSESSCEGRLRDLDASDDKGRPRQSQQNDQGLRKADPQTWRGQGVSTQTKAKLPGPNRSVSSQVMEYYYKYSQNANLDQYFSLPAPSASPECVRNYYSIYELYPKSDVGRQDCIGEEYSLRSYLPRERRRWVRPALIGQSSNGETSSRYVRPLTDPRSVSPDVKQNAPETIPEEKNESHETLPETGERKSSPTSSIASHKPLEWDSGADVGYFNTLPHNKKNNKKWSTIERMALARGCSAALRLDPEGTTESGLSGKATVQKSTANRPKSTMVPNANSTPLTENISGSESEIEITPIMKNHLSDVIAGGDIESAERSTKSTPPDVRQREDSPRSSKVQEKVTETSKSSFTFKTPSIKYPTEVRRTASKQRLTKESQSTPSSPLKKSTSMNTLPAPPFRMLLKRSQSDLNLLAKDRNKAILPLIFDSTSSISTVVNKVTTCDKFIQTSVSSCGQESVGVQVSVLEEERPPLPKRGTSLQKTLHSILKNPKGTYKVRNVQTASTNPETRDVGGNQRAMTSKTHCSSSEASQENRSTSATPQPDDTEDVTGRANSFEYFPGHVYENVPNASDSQVSSVDTGRSNSTLPNTSSSVNEKLWGDSDSLVRDLERSVSILKTLVDANKCDKNVKKRLIHHVVKRLITAKYTDDKIEHNLEDNVPWNPDDARKVYRTEILQALAKTHSTTDSSDDWKRSKEADRVEKSTGSERDILKDVGALESSNSDKFDRNTDRTEMDGRKARMGLRTDDCQQSSNLPTDQEKSESSECFFPQRARKDNKVKNIFCVKEKCKLPRNESTTTNSSQGQSRLMLDAVVNDGRLPVESSNVTENVDWRVPTTLSERQYELRKCSDSDSGDTKLVSYVEMEKKNQLIWITNEISHLSNLKKLLEQPRKLERPKSSPRKSKPSSFKENPITVHAREQNGHVDYSSRSALNEQKRTLNEQWSSHCNLASRESSPDDVAPTIHRVRKRNSCTQTATDAIDCHSRTGGEVVSASIRRGPTINSLNVGVQASLDADFFPASMRPQILHCIQCPVHKTIVHIRKGCACSEEVCRCPQRITQNPRSPCVCERWSITSGCRKVHEDVDDFERKSPANAAPKNSSAADSADLNFHSDRDASQLKQKETKNQINASKSRYICDCCDARGCRCVRDCRWKMTENGSDEKETSRKDTPPTMCRSCSRELSLAANGYARGCANIAHDARSDEEERGSVFKRNARCRRNNDDSKADSSENDGERRREASSSRNQRKETRRECRQTKVQISPKCNCGGDCSCAKRNAESQYGGSLKSNCRKESDVEGSERSYNKCCRACGVVYRNTRKCSCRQPYPKAVAYELSFAGKNNQKSDLSSVSTLPKVPLPDVPSSDNGKSGGCTCDVTNKNYANKPSSDKRSLQDYLSKNKPDFVGNAETRRQYMYEISHLRQLRKEKRMQLLAMASTSNIIKSPKSSKPTVCVQRRITDAEMKERLRKRYLRLNEVRLKRRQRERQEEARRNKLMAKIFCKKLQQKVLRGQVDLSQSVSVISNL